MNGDISSPTVVINPETCGYEEPQTRSMLDGKVTVELTHDVLDVAAALAHVKRPEAGAVVMFAGTTRDTFDSRPVFTLEYSAYVPLALQTMQNIALSIHGDHDLTAIYVVHRLGTVPIGEESILICVSAPHRTAAWRAGEHALERIKDSVEIWKLERFAGHDGEGEAVWRANRDGGLGEYLSPRSPMDMTVSPGGSDKSEGGSSTISELASSIYSSRTFKIRNGPSQGSLRASDFVAVPGPWKFADYRTAD